MNVFSDTSIVSPQAREVSTASPKPVVVLAGRSGVQQIGPDMDGFFASWKRDVLPALH
jgi:hypothetical protein